MKAMILAAGFGKRMLPLTKHTPKPLLTVNDQALIEYPIKKLAALGITDIIINHAYLGEKIVEHLQSGAQFGVNIHYSGEDEPLETAGGINNALDLLGDAPFILINGDVWSDIDLSLLTNKSINNLGHLILVDNPEHNPQGDFALDDKNRVIEKSANTGLTYSGMALLHPKLFKQYAINSGPLAPLLRLAIVDGLISGEHYKGAWFDIGTPQRLAELDSCLRNIE